MSKAQKFPITVKAGATSIKIYFSPQVVAASLPSAAKSGSRVKPKNKVTTYDSFIVSYYRGGTRARQRFNSLEAAKTEANRIRALLLNEDSVALQLTGKDLLTYRTPSQPKKRSNAQLANGDRVNSKAERT